MHTDEKEDTGEQEEELPGLLGVLDGIGKEIIDAAKSRNNVEPGKLGEHIDALFGALSSLSR